MDTEKFFILNKENALFDFTNFSELHAIDLDIAEHHVELTRHLQEIHQLFLVLKFNLDILEKEYCLMNTGRVFHNGQEAAKESDYIAINAFIGNIISSGRTLIENMECFVKEILPAKSESQQAWLNYYHDVYDRSFAYRFLIRLRDFSQHGHLPVSYSKDSYCFDLIQVLNKPHYNHNPKIKVELEKFTQISLETYRDTPTLSLTLTLAEYFSELMSIYSRFWTVVESHFVETNTKFKILLKEWSCNISFDYFAYKIVDSNAHLVSIKDEPTKMFNTYKKEAKQTYKEYRRAWEQIKPTVFRTVKKTEQNKCCD